MSSTSLPAPNALSVTILRWTARILSIASISLFVLFSFGGGGGTTLTPELALKLVCFPLGPMLGMVVGWRRELLGGAIVVACVALFHVLARVRAPWIALTCLPGPLFLLAGVLDARRSAPES